MTSNTLKLLVKSRHAALATLGKLYRVECMTPNILRRINHTEATLLKINDELHSDRQLKLKVTMSTSLTVR